MCKTDHGEGGGRGGKNIPKIDYVICEGPLKQIWLKIKQTLLSSQKSGSHDLLIKTMPFIAL